MITRKSVNSMTQAEKASSALSWDSSGGVSTTSTYIGIIMS
jgi:hypothetical protein